MRKESSRYSEGPARRSKGRPDVEDYLQALREQFAVFRNTHRPRTRIPDELRRSVVQAIRQGAGRTKVRRVCSVSSQQLDVWEKQDEEGALDSKGVQNDARIFSLDRSDEIPVEKGRTDLLELRLYGWSVTLRRIDERFA